MTAERPFSDISFARYLSEGKLMGSRCRDCGALSVPPRSICVKCYSSEMKWIEMEGKGTLSAFTCIAIGPPSMIAEGYHRKNPYCSGVVELAENVRVDARIEGVDTTKPEDIQIGMPMRVDYLNRSTDRKEKTYLAFRPA